MESRGGLSLFLRAGTASMRAMLAVGAREEVRERRGLRGGCKRVARECARAVARRRGCDGTLALHTPWTRQEACQGRMLGGCSVWCSVSIGNSETLRAAWSLEGG
jgi:hypothetical protein